MAGNARRQLAGPLHFSPCEVVMPDAESPWFYIDSEGAQQGPVTRKSLEDLRTTGMLGHNGLVWTSGMPEWQPLSSVFADLMPPPVPAHARLAEPSTSDNAPPGIPFTKAQATKSPAGTRFLLFGLLAAMCTLISFFLRTGGTKAWLMLTEYPYLLLMGMAEALGYSFISIGIGAILLTKDKVSAAFFWAGLVAVVFGLLPQQ